MKLTKEYYTTDEVAERYGVSELTVRRWIRDSWLSALDLGCGGRTGPYRISLDDLSDFEERQHVAAVKTRQRRPADREKKQKRKAG